ncbi:hypothetical protein PSTG_13324 [Puccinia striiformis f. sp. tritici PST-78]|uniref:Uncharacterized protein n=1 Tax=Puccinia striiformis f. sp. tritici PST-78 TaxID=1165861 RepID=A0A0L0V1W9_9BASI|nr:hypothetical protein PSTG_13324 [Puccinia striiformis f. sp. tritici PST-78]
MEGEDRLPLLARNTSLMEFEDDPKHGEYVLRHDSPDTPDSSSRRLELAEECETISSFEFGMYAGKQGFRRRRESQQRSNIAGASGSAGVLQNSPERIGLEFRGCADEARTSDIGHWAGSSPASSPVGGRNFQPGLPSRVISITLKITPTIWLGLVGSEVPQRLNFRRLLDIALA